MLLNNNDDQLQMAQQQSKWLPIGTIAVSCNEIVVDATQQPSQSI
jgi:hypothetical protein